MTTHTIEVTDIDEELLRSLDKRASQQAQDRSAYVRDLLRRDLAGMPTPVPEGSVAEALAPFHEAVRESGYTEEEVIGFFDEALREVRAERRAKRQQKTQASAEEMP